MPKIEWTEKMRVHVRELDDQHHAIFKSLAALEELAVTKAAKANVLAEFDHGLRLTVEHFKSEEVLLARCGYPGIGKQQTEHQSFVDRMKQFRRQIEAEPAVHTARAAQFAAAWLTKHIEGADAAYCEFLREQGIS